MSELLEKLKKQIHTQIDESINHKNQHTDPIREEGYIQALNFAKLIVNQEINHLNPTEYLSAEIYTRILKFADSLNHFSGEFKIIGNWKNGVINKHKHLVVTLWHYHVIGRDEYDRITKEDITIPLEALESDINMHKFYIKFRLKKVLVEDNRNGLVGSINYLYSQKESLMKEIEDAKLKYTNEYLQQELISLNKKLKDKNTEIDELDTEIQTIRQIIYMPFDKLIISSEFRRFYVNYHCSNGFTNFKTWNEYSKNSE